MYSILILSNSKYSYYLTSSGAVYTADDLETIADKVAELLETYTLGQIVVVKNCTITSAITVEEVTA